MVKKSIIWGARIGAAGGLALAMIATISMLMSAPEDPDEMGGSDLISLYAIVYIEVATGAVIGAGIGLIVGIAIKNTFSSDRE